MLPASNRGVGMNIGFPDVCLTPPAPAPVPYPNLAAHAMAAPFAFTVYVGMMNALNLASVIPMTSGDEGGTAHPTIKGAGTFTMGNPVVMVEGLPAINLLCPTTGNNMNDGLGAVLVPSAANVFYTRAGEAPATRLDRAQLARIARMTELERRPDRGVLLGGGVALLRVDVFSADVPARVHDAVRRLAPRALVLDVRGNPGGELTACVELAGDFLDPDSVILTRIDAEGDATVYRARQTHPYRFPLVLLVDRATASAAELFAGSMRAHRRALIVGEVTYGKGSAQQLLADLDGGGAHYATVATFALPDGTCIEARGVRPDLAIEAPALPAEAADPALEAALRAARAAAAAAPINSKPPEVCP